MKSIREQLHGRGLAKKAFHLFDGVRMPTDHHVEMTRHDRASMDDVPARRGLSGKPSANTLSLQAREDYFGIAEFRFRGETFGPVVRRRGDGMSGRDFRCWAERSQSLGSHHGGTGTAWIVRTPKTIGGTDYVIRDD